MKTQDRKNQQDDRREDPKRNRPPDADRRNPRLVVGGLDYFELLMEQNEQ